MKFPYKDEDINRWIYDIIPPEMSQASPSDIKIGVVILYKAEISSLKGLFIATKVSSSCFQEAIESAKRGIVYIKKRTFDNITLN